MTHRSSHHLGGFLLLACFGLCGCTMISASARKEAVATQPTATQCTVDFRASKRPPEVSHVDIPADATVQHVLNKSGAFRRFARLKIDLYRQTPQGAWHRMEVEYDRGSKTVETMHDYHMRPGDRLVVAEDTTDGLDDVMKSAAGPLGGLMGR